jgi:hypothetical protein
MANVDTDSDMDWMACELIERIPGKVSGRSISITQIRRLIEFAHAQP